MLEKVNGSESNIVKSGGLKFNILIFDWLELAVLITYFEILSFECMRLGNIWIFIRNGGLNKSAMNII